MSQQAKPQRRRFSPEKRREHLLDCAAELVSREGVAPLSMDRIAREAGVSKSLVYNYFDNVTELLSELLKREMQTSRRAQLEAAKSANTFEELVRNITHEYLTYIERRGLLIERLQSEPQVTSQHNPTDFDRDDSVDFLAKIAAKHFDLPLSLARAVTDISFGLPAAAGQYLLHKNRPRKEVEDITVTMIIGTFMAIKREELTHDRRLWPDRADKRQD